MGWRPMEGGLSASADGHLSHPWPTFQTPFLLPSHLQPRARSFARLSPALYTIIFYSHSLLPPAGIRGPEWCLASLEVHSQSAAGPAS